MNPIQTPPLPPPPLRNSSRRIARRFAAGTAAVLASGAIVAMPLAALAQDDDDGGDGWLADTLQELVDDGTITSEQADAVEGAIREARPERQGRGPGAFGHRGGGPLALQEAAAALGLDTDALREALRDGRSIADVAAEQGVDLQGVIDALVAAAEERLDEAVAEGEIDAERAAERRSALRDRITRLVEEDFPSRFGRFDCDDDLGDDAGRAAPGHERGDTEEQTEDTTEDTTVTTEDTTVTTPG